MSNIQKHIRRLRLFLQFMFVAVPVSVIFFWASISTPYDVLTSTGVVEVSFDINALTQQPLSITSRVLAAIANLLISGVAMYAIYILIRLFKNYEQGKIFSLENVSYYQKLGYSLFYWVLGNVIYGGVISVILSFNNLPGERYLELTFQGVDALTIMLGFLVLIISRVMKEGQIIADENRHTI
ncbi:DUF2975 domain-containing protein [Litoribacillus peritrichatus]|uniref:DUF2975 domain-containing protein n=1 Tax=Litoribacillus peritrichatus TaxID=718191 RepID=A0ABP7M7H5_9GAMM